MELSPKQVVAELDKYIVGQNEAKKAVAIALRNRYRRSKLDEKLREEVTPKNIIMKGPTGVGKTEIARRLSRLVNAPFVKVEATKFTEVGYVGRDVESMVRDLVDASILMVKKEKYAEVKIKAQDYAIDKIAGILVNDASIGDKTEDVMVRKQKIKEELLAGTYNDRVIEIEINEQPKQINLLSPNVVEFNMGDIMESFMNKPVRKRKKITVAKAKEAYEQEQCEKLIDTDSINAEALQRAEQNGIIFIDEIDKITGKGGNPNGPDVSREGVQRDILPIVEGCTVSTKYGPIKTDFILFIAAGAFHISKVEDLIPELQGRFPVLVELESLKKEDFKNILTSTENSLILQYTKLLEVDNVKLKFTNEAIDKISEIAELENETSENIGARRLHNVLELLLEDISFNASGEYDMTEVVIDKEYIKKHLQKTLTSFNLKKYIL